MSIKQIIHKLEEKSGVNPLNFSDEGVLSLLFNQEFTVNIEKSPDDRTITLYGNIGDLPLENREACLMTLLDANFFGKGTAGASFGLDSDTNEIYLFKTFDLFQLDVDFFIEEFGQFLQKQQEWTNLIKDKRFEKYNKMMPTPFR